MRALVLAVSAAVLAVVVACSGKTPCSAATCGTCCDAVSGECVSATSDQACGAAGNMCIKCDPGFACSAGKCQRTGTGGGAGGGSAGAGGGTAGGGTGGGTGGATGGGSGGGAAGGAAGGAVSCGTAPTAPRIPIEFPTTCPFPTPCGGNPAGVFFYTSACIPQAEVTGFKAQVESQCGANSVTIHSIDGGMQGYAFFDAGTVCRGVTGDVTVTASITGGCAIPLVCNQINGNIMGFTAACAVDGGSCDCSVTRNININNAAHYTTGPTTLTVVGTGQTFETCLTGGTVFATRELDAGSAQHEPGAATLTKQ